MADTEYKDPAKKTKRAGTGDAVSAKRTGLRTGSAVSAQSSRRVLRITVTEWCICLVLFGLIMGLELVNTAVEAVVDLATQDYHPLAKKAKDTAAGAVLIASIMAAIAGLIIFVPRLFQALGIHLHL